MFAHQRVSSHHVCLLNVRIALIQLTRPQVQLLNTSLNALVSASMPVVFALWAAPLETAKPSTPVVFRFTSTFKRRLKAAHKAVFAAAQPPYSTRCGT